VGKFAGAYDDVCQELTKLVLSRFFFVGLVEEMPRSIRLLKKKLSPLGLRLKPPLLQRFNKTKGFENLRWLNESDPIGSKVLNATKFENISYHQFRDRFFEEYRSFEKGEVMGAPEELHEFQSLEDWAVSAYLNQHQDSERHKNV
jgi:hypothetical protein